MEQTPIRKNIGRTKGYGYTRDGTQGSSLEARIAFPARTMYEYKYWKKIQQDFLEYVGDIDHRLEKQKIRDLLQEIDERELKMIISEKKIERDRTTYEYKGSYDTLIGLHRYCVQNHIPSDIRLEKLAYDSLVQTMNEVGTELLNEYNNRCIRFLDRELRDRSMTERRKQVDLDALKDRVEILDVIESYVTIGRYKPGQLIKCPLPTHEDKSSSFMIYSKNNTWHCFGCHGGGSQLDFIMRMEKCTLPEAIKKLSNY